MINISRNATKDRSAGILIDYRLSANIPNWTLQIEDKEKGIADTSMKLAL